MKKIFFLCGIMCYSAVLSSCIEIVQHITEKPDGTVQNTVRITVSKTLLAMAATMNGKQDPLNYNELFDQFNPAENYLHSNKLIQSTINKVNDPNDIGYLITMNINYRDEDVQNALVEDTFDFIPLYGKKMIIIPITQLEDSDSEVNNEMAELFFSSSKYRLLINKSVMPTISKVLVNTVTESSEVHFIDLYNEYLIEIPIIVLIHDEVNLEIYR
ncbi:MAG: hypothetical protein ACTTH7_07655 [Treponema sp.]